MLLMVLKVRKIIFVERYFRKFLIKIRRFEIMKRYFSDYFRLVVLALCKRKQIICILAGA